MLSICIPIYNHDVTALVSALTDQIANLKEKIEIVLIDDCSQLKYQELNESVCCQHIYVKLDQNVGRAKIRNLFLIHAHYDYLLYLDCDAQVISDSLISVYIDNLKCNKYNVYCGGSIYSEKKPERTYRLRWKNGHVRETILADIRNKNPYSAFMTSNVIIKRSVFDHICFDEKLVKYGHEDTLFGYALGKHREPILHIDNSVLNYDLDSNILYIEKIEASISNISYILDTLNYDSDFINGIKLLKTYFYLKSHHLSGCLNFIFFFLKNPIRTVLSKGWISLYLFDFYKLGLLSKTIKNQ